MSAPTLLQVKAALQGAHMDLEELQQDAEEAARNYQKFPAKLQSLKQASALELTIEVMEEAAADVYAATEALDRITPEGT